MIQLRTEMIIGEDDFIIDDYHLCDYIFRIGQKEGSIYIFVIILYII